MILDIHQDVGGPGGANFAPIAEDHPWLKRNSRIQLLSVSTSDSSEPREEEHGRVLESSRIGAIGRDLSFPFSPRRGRTILLVFREITEESDITETDTVGFVVDAFLPQGAPDSLATVQ